MPVGRENGTGQVDTAARVPERRVVAGGKRLPFGEEVYLRQESQSPGQVRDMREMGAERSGSSGNPTWGDVLCGPGQASQEKARER